LPRHFSRAWGHAEYSGLKYPELEFNWKKELPTFQGFSTTVVPFLVLWFLSLGFYGTQRGIFRSYAAEENEVGCPQGLIFPPMVGANPHANIDPPPRRNDPGRGGAASLGTRDVNLIYTVDEKQSTTLLRTRRSVPGFGQNMNPNKRPRSLAG